MTIKKSIIKFSIILTIILLTLLTRGLTVSFAAPVDAIDMEVVGGYDGIGMLECYNPFKITIHNGGNDFTGELQIIYTVNLNSKGISSEAVNIAKGATKIYTINAPVNTIDRKIQIILTSGRYSEKILEYRFTKLIPPESTLMGIICDDASGMDGLKGLSILGNDRPVEFIDLNADSFPEDIRSLRAFHTLFLSNFDTSSLSDKQISALTKWVDEGRQLLVGTGDNWKKTYSGLPATMTPFLIDGSNVIDDSNMVQLPSGGNISLPALNITTGNKGDGKVIINENEVPLAINYAKAHGLITILTFDPSTDPISSWSGVQPLIGSLLSEGYNLKNIETSNISKQLKNLMKAAGYLPNVEMPSLGIYILIITFYIILVGPCAYFFLKWSNKTDLYWILVPLVAFLFTGIIWSAGYKTRSFDAAIDSLSFVKIDDGTMTAQTDMYIGAYSSRAGLMKISYEKYADVYPETNKYYQPYDKLQQSENALFKFSANPVSSCELFGARVWEPRFLTVSATENLEGCVLNSVNVGKNSITAIVNNPTRFDFDDSFFVYNNKFIHVGAIKKGQEKNMEIQFDNPSSMMDIKELINSEYIRNPLRLNNRNPQLLRENNQIRQLLTIFYKDYVDKMANDRQLWYFAFNSDSPGHYFKINDETPEYFNANIICTSFKTEEHYAGD